MRRHTAFGPLSIAWDERVLEPRPWTAVQSRWAAEILAAADQAPGPLLELCTGAGHIGLLAAALTSRPLVAVDVEPVACGYARENAVAAGLAERVEVREGRFEEVLAEGELFALALADPPWVASSDTGRFPDDPLLAVDGGDDGLDLARACVAATRGHLPHRASLLVQLGTLEQAHTLAAEVHPHGWADGEVRAGAGGVVLRLLHP